MKRVVWKYVLSPYQISVEVPVGAQLLYATEQYGAGVLYALVDPDEQAKEHRPVLILGTGQEIAERDDSRFNPLGLVKLNDGALMFHVFEIVAP